MKAVYPGTFDPFTNGHLDLVQRGSRLFEHLVVAVAVNPAKAPVFSVEERVAMIRELARDIRNVTVDSFQGLVVDYASSHGLGTILRGLRTFSDFEYEFQMALTNRTFAPSIETAFVMPSLNYSYVSSRLIKESIAMGADVRHLLPALVEQRLRAKLGLKPLTRENPAR
jgi:pantetheine-phosphate adenylyltransferase